MISKLKVPDLKKVFLEFFYYIHIDLKEVYFMAFLRNCAMGIAIGSGAILPGISSGIFCVIFGIYEKLIDSILNFFKYPKKNFKFLLPIIIGIFIGVFIFSNLINYFLIKFPIQTKSIFIGLILGSIPSLIKETNKNFKFKSSYFIYTILAFIIGIVSVFIEKNNSFNLENQSFSYIYLILSGFLMSAGVIIPGVSSTVILMILRVYPSYLSSISSLYFPTLIPIGIGLGLGSFILMKATNFLLKKYYTQTFYTIIGFTLGSILVLFPNVQSDLNGLICIICISIGCIIINLFKD